MDGVNNNDQAAHGVARPGEWCCAGCGRRIGEDERRVFDRQEFRVFHADCMPVKRWLGDRKGAR